MLRVYMMHTSIPGFFGHLLYLPISVFFCFEKYLVLKLCSTATLATFFEHSHLYIFYKTIDFNYFCIAAINTFSTDFH